ncbi:MAG: ABC transporter permease subunit [Pseudomonas sp.]
MLKQLNKPTTVRDLLKPSLLIALVLVAPFVIGLLGGNYWIRVLDFALLYIMLALGLNIVVGFAGLLDLGYIAFYAVGAYTAALLGSSHLADNFASIHQLFPQGLHLSLWLILPGAALLAGIFGILLGTPTLRLRGDYLAIVTLGFGEIIRIFINNLDRPLNFTNGPKGISGIDPATFFGFDLSLRHSFFGVRFDSVLLYYYLFVVVVVLIAFICHRLQHSRIGRGWIAIREDEIAAKAMGINTRNLKLAAFAMGASFGGLAGVMFGSFQGFVSPESFSLMESITVLVMVVLGGMGHIPGVILGGVLLAVLPEALRATVAPLQIALFGKVVIEAEVVRQLLYGLAMILIVLYRPSGLWPSPRKEDRPVQRQASGLSQV